MTPTPLIDTHCHLDAYDNPILLLDQARAAGVHVVAVTEDALAGGLWFSINPAMAASTRSRALLARLPPDRVLLETDGPFARHGGRAARPGDLVPLLQTSQL